MVGSVVDLIQSDEPMPMLPTARAYWKPRGDFVKAAEGWLNAGGGHHHVLTTALGAEVWTDLSRMVDVDWVLLDDHKA